VTQELKGVYRLVPWILIGEGLIVEHGVVVVPEGAHLLGDIAQRAEVIIIARAGALRLRS
jgi:hypothetical protein